MVSLRIMVLVMAAVSLSAGTGCGSSWWKMEKSDEHPVLAAPPEAPPAQEVPKVDGLLGGPTRRASEDNPANAQSQTHPHPQPVPRHPTAPAKPAPVGLIHPPEAPLKAPATLPPSEASIPVSIIGSWQDDRGADLMFTEDGRFEIDARTPNGSKVRAVGDYVLTGSKATLTYTGFDLTTADPNETAKSAKIKDEFMKKGPGAAPQIESIEMKTKDTFVMRLVGPGTGGTIAVLKRKK